MRKLVIGVMSLLFLLSGFEAIASTGEGGGNVLACFDKNDRQTKRIINKTRKKDGKLEREYISKIISLELLELIEAKRFRDVDNVPVQVLISKDESVSEYIERVKERFQTYLPFYVDVIEVGQNIFSKMNIQRVQEPLKQVRDFVFKLNSQEEEHCVILTVARQFDATQGEVLELDQPLLDKLQELSPTSVSVLFLHEYVYQVMRRRGSQSSDETRNLVKQLISYSSNSRIKDLYTSFLTSRLRGFADGNKSELGELEVYFPEYPYGVHIELRELIGRAVYDMLVKIIARISEDPKDDDNIKKGAPRVKELIEEYWPTYSDSLTVQTADLFSVDQKSFETLKEYFDGLGDSFASVFRSQCYYLYSSVSFCSAYASLLPGNMSFDEWWIDGRYGAREMFSLSKGYDDRPTWHQFLVNVDFSVGKEHILPKLLYDEFMIKKLNLEGELVSP